MTATPRVALGHIDLPEGWSMATQIELTEPPGKGIAMPLAGRGETKRPGANIMVARASAPRTTAQQALDGFVKSYASCVEQVSRLHDDMITFADGREGVSVTLAFSVDGFRAAQRHLFRIDDGIATHITISVDEGSKTRLDDALLAVALSFRLPSAIFGAWVK